MKGIVCNIFTSVSSAVVIALLLFVWNDHFLKIDRLTGYWNVNYVTEKTTYDAFHNLEENYDFLITQSDNTLSGSGEKISELSPSGFIEYDAEKRTHVKILGNLKYNFFSESEVDISHVEKGRKRESSRILRLKVISNDLIIGTFISTIADSSGHVRLTRKNGS
ncbi:MAG: hypothetical protein GY806_02090 [Gammaproteobacteria bacterium]|nr:hypothetical protein [Gammaproteobacteria bacterium]